MLSRLQESESSSETNGAISLMSEMSAEWNLLVRARAQLRLPWMVLISPLWAR